LGGARRRVGQLTVRRRGPKKGAVPARQRLTDKGAVWHLSLQGGVGRQGWRPPSRRDALPASPLKGQVLRSPFVGPPTSESAGTAPFFGPLRLSGPCVFRAPASTGRTARRRLPRRPASAWR